MAILLTPTPTPNHTQTCHSCSWVTSLIFQGETTSAPRAPPRCKSPQPPCNPQIKSDLPGMAESHIPPFARGGWSPSFCCSWCLEPPPPKTASTTELSLPFPCAPSSESPSPHVHLEHKHFSFKIILRWDPKENFPDVPSLCCVYKPPSPVILQAPEA